MGRHTTGLLAYNSSALGLSQFGPQGGLPGSEEGNGTSLAPALTLIDDDIDCFGIPVENSDATITGSVIISDGLIGPTVQTGHYEPIYTGHNDYIVGNTIINPQINTSEIFGDQNCGTCGTLTDLTIENNLLAGNQNNGALAMGCTANGGTAADFGHGPNTNVAIENNRFTTAYNNYWTNPAATHGGPTPTFSAGNTDGQSGTTWSGNYLDNNLSTVTAPTTPC